MGLPVIDVIFKQLAVTAVTRSERGVAAIILRDDTDNTPETGDKILYKYETDVKSADYTVENMLALTRCWLDEVYKIWVIKIPTEADFTVATTILDKLKYNYVCATAGKDQQALASYVKTKNANSKGKVYFAVTYNATVTDSKFIINLPQYDSAFIEKYTDHDGNTATREITPLDWLPRLTTRLATLPLNRSITYYSFQELAEVPDLSTPEKDLDAWIDDGYLVLINDEEEVKCGRGRNSLVSYTKGDTEDMSSILIMESIALMTSDIYKTYKSNYVGKFKNKCDNQMLFVTSVNGYFRSLTTDEAGEILDNSYENHCGINVEAQRTAWLEVGKADAEDWSDEKVKAMSFKKKVFISARVKILDAMEDLQFIVNME